MPSKPAFPNPAATLPGEADVLANVLANLADHDAKLVYADWLEERDDARGPLLREFVTAFRAGEKLPALKSAPKPWYDLVGLTLIEKAQEWLAPHTDTFLRLARPALRLEMIPTPDEGLPIGGSKLAGLPDMPANAEWPECERGTLDFMAQINLADVASSVVCRELPPEGILSFFVEESAIDRTDIGGWRVFHFADATALVRRPRPASLQEWVHFSPHCFLFTETLTLTCRNYSPWNDELSLSEDDAEAYWELYGHSCGPRLLGYPQPIQNDVLTGKDDRHLLTVAPGNVFYFTIKEEDLRQHRFDRTGFEMQR